jgi:hypothetical protein
MLGARLVDDRLGRRSAAGGVRAAGVRAATARVVGCVLLLAASRGEALTLLTADEVAVFRSGAAPTALVRVGRDRALRGLQDPVCPQRSSLRFALSRRGADFENHGEMMLPCAGWRHQGHRRRYVGDPGSGVEEIVFGANGLRIRAGGPGFEAVAGPVAYVEVWLTVGSERYLVRFHRFRQNDAAGIVTHRPSRLAAAGEAAFWDTLWHDAPREDEALSLLRRAVRRDPGDGRSQFLLGMLHLYRSGETTAGAPFDLRTIDDAGRAEIGAAQVSLDRAVALLPEDTRVPGFRAAATYANGFVHGDGAGVALGLSRLDDAIATNPVFNSFDLFAVVAPNVAGTDAFFQTRVLSLVDLVLIRNSACPFSIPEICGNEGMAPHNLEGTLVLLGDLYAKGGRLADAQQWYGLEQAVGPSSGYRFQALADDHAAHVTERVALAQDADPGNDLPIVGGGGAACVYCHNK